MSIETAREHLKKWNKDQDIIELNESSATVALAAKALGTQEERIAKTLSFILEDKPILVIAAGDAKVQNRKYRDCFGSKARMISHQDVNTLIGHEPGGVCPFGIKDTVRVYLDVSLKRFDLVYPACGSSNSAIPLSLDELEEISGADSWVDVCIIPDDPAPDCQDRIW